MGADQYKIQKENVINLVQQCQKKPTSAVLGNLDFKVSDLVSN